MTDGRNRGRDGMLDRRGAIPSPSPCPCPASGPGGVVGDRRMSRRRHRHVDTGGRAPRTCPDRYRTRGSDTGGPLVVLCNGDHCSALHRRTGSAALERLRETARATTGAVLVSSGCLGRCELAAVVLLGWAGSWPGQLLPLAGMEDPDRVNVLLRWLPGRGPARALRTEPVSASGREDAVHARPAPSPGHRLPVQLADALTEAIRPFASPSDLGHGPDSLALPPSARDGSAARSDGETDPNRGWS